MLADHGLEAAIESLAARSAVPTHVEVDAGVEASLSVEVAAYYLVSEPLTNVARYAEATGVVIRVRRLGDRLAVEIVDDGVGGADPARGTGLRGLADRVEALGGTLIVVSPRGAGTVVRAELPAP